MAFAVRHRKRARAELNDCAARLGGDFLHSVEAWLADLADEAECGAEEISSDAVEFFKLLGNEFERFVQKAGLDHARTAGFQEKVRAFVVWLRSWLQGGSPAWELRMAIQVFLIPNIVSRMPEESPGVVMVLYEVDRVRKRIVVTKYVELPSSSREGA